MKVLIIAPYAIWTPHHETDLEIAQRHLDENDEVVMLVCNASLTFCDPNPDHRFSTCLRCIGRRKIGFGQLRSRIRTRPIINLTQCDKEALSHLQTTFSSVEELKDCRVEEFDIGWAVLSSFISWRRDPEFNICEDSNRAAVQLLFSNAFAVYRSVLNYLRSEAFDLAYVFNGRMALTRAAFRACLQERVTCFVHDRGCDFQHYDLYENVLPHDITYAEQKMRQAWQAADPIKREQIGCQFYEERAQGKKQNWISFVSGQNPALLPENFSYGDRNVVIFTSSEDEFVAIGDQWKNSIYRNQLEGLKNITKDLTPDNRIHLFIRIHPNLTGVNVNDVKETLRLEAHNVTVIPPNSPVSSYALLKNAERVLTFGSTMGIEASFWGKPSILAGISFYRNLGATFNPHSHQEVMQLLRKKSLSCKPQEGALMYGYYEKTRGVKFQYFEGIDVRDGLFNNIRIRPSLPYWFLGRSLSLFEKIFGQYST